MLVPIVFYSAYNLLSHSADVPTKSVDIGTQVVEKGKQVASSFLSPPGPPPGTAWIAEVDRLQEQLSLISLLQPARLRERNRLHDQLNSIREHCETHTEVLHSTVDTGTHLGRTIAGIRDAIDHLQLSATTAPVSEHWKSAYDSSESKRIVQQAHAFHALYEQEVAPMRQAHSTRLASLTRQSRELANELQRTLDNIQQMERDTREHIAKRQRLESYVKDKDEVARLLKPFITPGYGQLRDAWNDWKTTTEKKPLSFRDLERLGALATDINGVRIFARIGGMPTHLYPNSARPLGGFPAYYDHTLSNPKQLETIKRAQQLIRRHSVYLIEAGLLQP